MQNFNCKCLSRDHILRCNTDPDFNNEIIFEFVVNYRPKSLAERISSAWHILFKGNLRVSDTWLPDEEDLPKLKNWLGEISE